MYILLNMWNCALYTTTIHGANNGQGGYAASKGLNRLAGVNAENLTIRSDCRDIPGRGRKDGQVLDLLSRLLRRLPDWVDAIWRARGELTKLALLSSMSEYSRRFNCVTMSNMDYCLYFKAEEEGIKGADRPQNKISFAFSKLNSIIPSTYKCGDQFGRFSEFGIAHSRQTPYQAAWRMARNRYRESFKGEIYVIELLISRGSDQFALQIPRQKAPDVIPIATNDAVEIKTPHLSPSQVRCVTDKKLKGPKRNLSSTRKSQSIDVISAE
jgi:hypothetical protein